MELGTILTLILALPLFSATFIVCFLVKRGNLAAFISVVTAFGIMGLSLLALFAWKGEVLHVVYPWFTLGSWQVSMGYLFDKNAVTMILVVSVVAFLIHVFSVEYMRKDASKARYFAGLSLFMFAMLGIVLADNLIMLFIFWELVGFGSYALIAHYNQMSYASMASKKAFIVNRVGDFGFLIGIIWVYSQFGTVQLVELESMVHLNPALISTGVAFLLMCGFLGKSAQFPLQVWLPDAMAGPTPVSALIHAATMVAAGIYFIIRVYFLFPPEVLTWILWLGAGMTLYAGLCALAQSDIKKILAYSTLSQLGYMAVALGLGFPGLALFHLATHACFKALLFLGAGSVIHSLHHEQNIFKMGHLRKSMPLTTLTFAIGLLALCGVTFTSGYFSKDAIIEGAYLMNKAVFCLVMASAFLTSIYMGRLFWVAFFGAPKSQAAQKAHESGFFALMPLVILAILSLVAGYVALWPELWSLSFLKEFEELHTQFAASGASKMMMVLATSAWVLGLGLTYFFYQPGSQADRLQKSFPMIFRLLESKFYFDELYNFYVTKIQQRIANFFNFFDLVVIAGFIVRGSAGLIGLVSLLVKGLHVGSLHAYVYWFLAGVILFSAFAIGVL